MLHSSFLLFSFPLSSASFEAVAGHIEESRKLVMKAIDHVELVLLYSSLFFTPVFLPFRLDER